MKRIAILGSTGSIGQSTLDLLASRQDEFDVVFLAAHRSAKQLAVQAGNFAPRHVCLAGFGPDESPPATIPGHLHRGAEGILTGLEDSQPDCVLNAITGAAGLTASAWTLENGLDLLLANKESLVVAGPFLRGIQKRSGGRILPVDSEHAAIHQCLRGERIEDVRRVYLTASGGPFRDTAKADMDKVSIADALAHPTWKMGPRITIGSATLMNKAFEVIEACHLFGFSADRVEVLVHRQSIVHSIVEFRDGSMMAQLGVPDMRVPILYCLSWPDRFDFDFEPFDMSRFATLTFEAVDPERFPALALGYACVRSGGDSGVVLNAADEVATGAFLEGQIAFPRIIETVERVLSSHEVHSIESLNQVAEVDAWARREAEACLQLLP